MEWVERQRPEYLSEYAKVMWFFSPKGKKWPLYSMALFPVAGHTKPAFSVKYGTHIHWESTHNGVPDDLFVIMIHKLESYLELPRS